MESIMSITSALLPLDTAAEPSATRNASLTRLTAGTPRAPTTAEAASTSTLDASLVGVGGVVGGGGGGGPCWDAMVTFWQVKGGVCQANSALLYCAGNYTQTKTMSKDPSHQTAPSPQLVWRPCSPRTYKAHVHC